MTRNAEPEKNAPFPHYIVSDYFIWDKISRIEKLKYLFQHNSIFWENVYLFEINWKNSFRNIIHSICLFLPLTFLFEKE